jgi:hypothetical protein
LTANLLYEMYYYFPVPGNGRKMSVFWIKKHCMFGTFTVYNAAFISQMANEVTALHGTIL